MKTKLTLTVRKSVIDKAKHYSEQTGKSISQLVEEYFDGINPVMVKTEAQLAADKLLQILDASPVTNTLDDKTLLKEYAARKFA